MILKKNDTTEPKVVANLLERLVQVDRVFVLGYRNFGRSSRVFFRSLRLVVNSSAVSAGQVNSHDRGKTLGERQTGDVIFCEPWRVVVSSAFTTPPLAPSRRVENSRRSQCVSAYHQGEEGSCTPSCRNASWMKLKTVQTRVAMKRKYLSTCVQCGRKNQGWAGQKFALINTSCAQENS